MPITLLRLLSLAFMTTLTHAASVSRLPDCPKTPNCVSSQASTNDSEHYTAPFVIKGDPDAAWIAVQQALLQQGRTVLTNENAITLHAEATSFLFRFVDDIDVLLDVAHRQIHIRSASRTGYSDLGVNRKRVTSLRETLQEQQVIE